MKKKKVGVIGSIGNSADGQTIKTMTLLSALKKNTDWKIFEINTGDRNRHPVRLFIRTIFMLLRCKDVFILVSRNGAKFFFPLLSFFSKVFKVRVYHDVIGSCAVNYAKQSKKHVNILNSFKVNWVETRLMLEELNRSGVKNAEQLYNFKDLQIIDIKDLKEDFVKPYPLCTFSRVVKEKGIEDAVKAVEAVNKEKNDVIFSLDIYGAIDEGYKNDFNKLLKSSNSEISYKGIIPYNKSVEIIKNYFALLFPTYWEGEGFPGTIIDSLFAGVPVIATDWKSNSELICNYQTGIVYPNDEIKDLYSALIRMADNYHALIQMRRNCISEAKRYEPDKLVNEIIKKVEERNK